MVLHSSSLSSLSSSSPLVSFACAELPSILNVSIYRPQGIDTYKDLDHRPNLGSGMQKDFPLPAGFWLPARSCS